jgi:small-conductance mechanosensitive channel
VQYLEELAKYLPQLLTSLSIIAMVLAVIWVANWVLLRRTRDLGEERQFPRRIAMVVITILGIVIILLTFPVADSTRDQLVALVGLITTAAIALASTTFVANAMAGLMLRTVRSFRPGDFVRVGENFGRVTERGLFHTEIQTEDRDLVTLPNLYLVTNPVKVIRISGTIVSANVSLGYDQPRQEVRSLLLAAADAADLKDPFVQIEELGDFSINYRVAGLLPEVKQLLTARSLLRSKMLDMLHGAGVEIVSPNFMNQRQLRPEDAVIPPEPPPDNSGLENDEDDVPEEILFDKAEAAEHLERLRLERTALVEKQADLRVKAKKADEEEGKRLKRKVELIQKRCDEIGQELDEA